MAHAVCTSGARPFYTPNATSGNSKQPKASDWHQTAGQPAEAQDAGPAGNPAKPAGVKYPPPLSKRCNGANAGRNAGPPIGSVAVPAELAPSPHATHAWGDYRGARATPKLPARLRRLAATPTPERSSCPATTGNGLATEMQHAEAESSTSPVRECTPASGNEIHASKNQPPAKYAAPFTQRARWRSSIRPSAASAARLTSTHVICATWQPVPLGEPRNLNRVRPERRSAASIPARGEPRLRAVSWPGVQ